MSQLQPDSQGSTAGSTSLQPEETGPGRTATGSTVTGSRGPETRDGAADGSLTIAFGGLRRAAVVANGDDLRCSTVEPSFTTITLKSGGGLSE